MSTSDPTQAQLNALSAQAAAEQTGAAESLAGAAAYNEFAGRYQPPPPAPSGPEAAHPSASRLATSQWAGMTSQQNHAQRAQAASAVPWVTVPVDRILVAPSGSASVTPVYAGTQGYAEAPGESAGSIPPNFKRAQ